LVSHFRFILLAVSEKRLENDLGRFMVTQTFSSKFHFQTFTAGSAVLLLTSFYSGVIFLLFLYTLYSLVQSIKQASKTCNQQQYIDVTTNLIAFSVLSTVLKVVSSIFYAAVSATIFDLNDWLITNICKK
jgi:Ni/Fe-hydrogenase subunit HybB-like protein